MAKTTKKTAAKKTTALKNVKDITVDGKSIIATDTKPTLKELLAGGPAVEAAVAKAVADRAAVAAPVIAKVVKDLKHDAKAMNDAAAALATKLPKKTATAPSKPEKGESIAATLRRLINEGLENDVIFERAKKENSLFTDDKKWFISWYRSDMKRKAAKAGAATAAPKTAKKNAKKDLPKVTKVATKKVKKAS